MREAINVGNVNFDTVRSDGQVSRFFRPRSRTRVLPARFARARARMSDHADLSEVVYERRETDGPLRNDQGTAREGLYTTGGCWPRKSRVAAIPRKRTLVMSFRFAVAPGVSEALSAPHTRAREFVSRIVIANGFLARLQR